MLLIIHIPHLIDKGTESQKIVTYPESVRGAAILVNPDQSGLKIYTLNHSLLGTVPGSGGRQVLWGWHHSHQGHPPWLTITTSPVARGQEAKARELVLDPLPWPSHPTLRAAYTRLLQPLSTLSRQVPFLPRCGAHGEQTLAWQVSRPGAGQEEAGPESGSKEHLNL